MSKGQWGLIARVIFAAAALVALSVLCASCGGGDDSGDTTAATRPPAPAAETPRDEPGAPSTGGAAAPRGTTSPSTNGGARPADDDSAAQPLSPAAGDAPRRSGKRRSKRVTRDVYKAGKETCFIFGIDQIRREYALAQRSPEAVARFYAGLFEKGNPDLVAPYYQGCLKGLRQRAERDRQVNQR